MSVFHSIFRRVLGAADIIFGILLIFWPGVWHELVHGWVERTTFYLAQGVGVTLLARGIVVLRRADVGRLYALTVPGVVFLAWITAETGPISLVFYLSLVALWCGGAWCFRSSEPDGRD